MYKNLATCEHFCTCTNNNISSNRRPDVGEPRDKLWYYFLYYQTLGPPKLPVIHFRNLQPYGMRIKQSKVPMPIFYNTRIQWLDSSAVIKKGLCAFNNRGKERIKQIFQELQHQPWVGGADSINGWLTQLWDDTVTAILFAEGNWHHRRRTRDYCWNQGQCAERRQRAHLFWGISHLCPTHTPDKERSENRSSAVSYNTDAHGSQI